MCFTFGDLVLVVSLWYEFWHFVAKFWLVWLFTEDIPVPAMDLDTEMDTDTSAAKSSRQDGDVLIKFDEKVKVKVTDKEGKKERKRKKSDRERLSSTGERTYSQERTGMCIKSTQEKPFLQNMNITAVPLKNERFDTIQITSKEI